MREEGRDVRSLAERQASFERRDRRPERPLTTSQQPDTKERTGQRLGILERLGKPHGLLARSVSHCEVAQFGLTPGNDAMGGRGR